MKKTCVVLLGVCLAGPYLAVGKKKTDPQLEKIRKVYIEGDSVAAIKAREKLTEWTCFTAAEDPGSADAIIVIDTKGGFKEVASPRRRGTSSGREDPEVTRARERGIAGPVVSDQTGRVVGDTGPYGGTIPGSATASNLVDITVNVLSPNGKTLWTKRESSADYSAQHQLRKLNKLACKDGGK